MNAEDKEPTPKKGVMECPECFSPRATYEKQPHTLRLFCLDCGLKSAEYAEDNGGSISVPWGFLL